MNGRWISAATRRVGSRRQTPAPERLPRARPHRPRQQGRRRISTRRRGSSRRRDRDLSARGAALQGCRRSSRRVRLPPRGRRTRRPLGPRRLGGCAQGCRRSVATNPTVRSPRRARRSCARARPPGSPSRAERDTSRRAVRRHLEHRSRLRVDPPDGAVAGARDPDVPRSRDPARQPADRHRLGDLVRPRVDAHERVGARLRLARRSAAAGEEEGEQRRADQRDPDGSDGERPAAWLASEPERGARGLDELAQVWKRSSGSFASAVGMHLLEPRRAGGPSSRWANRTAASVARRNGGSPVRHS